MLLFSEGFIVAVFFFSFNGHIYPLLINSFRLFLLYVHWFVWWYVCFFFVSVFLALLVFLFAFSPKQGCINVSRVYLRIVHSLNYSIIIIPFSSVRKCWPWSLKGISMSGREKMSTNVKFESTRRCVKDMNSAKERQKINPSVPWWVFGAVSIYILIIIIIIIIIVVILFSVQSDFQGQDAM